MVGSYHRTMNKLSRIVLVALALIVTVGFGASQVRSQVATQPASHASSQASSQVASKPTQSTPRGDADSGSAKSPKAKRGPGLRYGIADAPKKTRAIRLAAYNVQNLCDHVDDPNLSGEWDDMKLAVTEDRAQALAKVIRRLDADVLFLQEVESQEALTWFRDTYIKDMGYTYLASLDAGYYRGIEQSVLSRFPIKNARVFLDAKLGTAGGSELSADDTKELQNKPDAAVTPAPAQDKAPEDATKFQRSPLAVDIELPDGYVLSAYAIHHKAGGVKFEEHRKAEAAKIIEFVKADLAKNPDANIVILGDFNSTPLSQCRKMYKDAGWLNGYDYRPQEDITKDRNKSLPQAERDALREQYTTHESGRPIDYIIISKGFANEIVPGSYFVLSSLHPGDAYDWKKDKPPAGYASDHYPIAIEFTPKDAKPKAAKTNDAKPNDAQPKESAPADAS